MADRIAVMHRGVLQQMRTPAQIYNHPLQHLRRRLHRQPRHEPATWAGDNPRMAGSALAGDGGWLLSLADGPRMPRAVEQYRSGDRRRAPRAYPALARTRKPAGWKVASTPSSPPETSPTFISSWEATCSSPASHADFRAAPDAPIWITFDREHLHLFDAETEQILARGTPACHCG